MADFEEHLEPYWPGCVVAFASGDSQRFEWGATLRRWRARHVLIRDASERWYLDGVSGLGDLHATALYLVALRRRYGKVTTLGLSSGSYAALLYGALACLDTVVAVSPITGKGAATFGDFDPCWHHRLEHGPEHPPVMDLATLYLGSKRLPSVRAFVSDGEGTELDEGMMLRLGVARDRITTVPGYSHSALARALRDYHNDRLLGAVLA